MATHLVYFVLAFVVSAIGLQAMGEHRDAFGVVPRQVMRPAASQIAWGRVLASLGGLALAIGALGVSQPDLDQVLLGGLVINALVLLAYALWILVGSGKVAYQATPSEDHHH